MLSPSLQKNDRKANILIITFSVIVFGVVVALGRLPKMNLDLGFDVHLFAAANAIINSMVTVLLIAALALVRNKKFVQHRNIMYAALVLSILFLVSYIAHHLLTGGGTKYGDSDFDGVLSAAEVASAGAARYIYYFILVTHIFLASIILPFILFTAYRAMSGEYARHKKLARITWPIWLYVSITGVVVYLMISPYYS